MKIEIRLHYSQPVCYQQLYDEPFSLSAKLSKHALLEGHVVVSDVQYRVAVILSGKWRNSCQANHKGVKCFTIIILLNEIFFIIIIIIIVFYIALHSQLTLAYIKPMQN